ncbi:SDR family NAD(P)-dependent oxidoreductase [Silvibacterium acidisoli]|uniref:SDR family NAD(P)-dependent oxidoreductase n=1 Tax=Acidobacteriaceae bacterium ZG23-2 TaxID=2883246 RepID=UPI00406C7930
MSNLNGKVAIVTGASKGVGAGVAKNLAASGASVVVNYTSAKADADKVVAEITSKGGKALAVQADVSKAADVARLFTEAKATFGQIDILVNNAGVYAFAPLEALTEDDFHRHFNINVLGTLLTTREAAKYFGPAGGSVINISSGASIGRMPNTVVYAASKSAMDAVTRVLSVELAPKKIRVNTVAPGATATEGLTAMGAVGTDYERVLVATIPFGRLGRPDDIAKAVHFLASDDSAWVTGEYITASGGQRL